MRISLPLFPINFQLHHHRNLFYSNKSVQNSFKMILEFEIFFNSIQPFHCFSSVSTIKFSFPHSIFHLIYIQYSISCDPTIEIYHFFHTFFGDFECTFSFIQPYRLPCKFHLFTKKLIFFHPKFTLFSTNFSSNFPIKNDSSSSRKFIFSLIFCKKFTQKIKLFSNFFHRFSQ